MQQQKKKGLYYLYFKGSSINNRRCESYGRKEAGKWTLFSGYIKTTMKILKIDE